MQRDLAEIEVFVVRQCGSDAAILGEWPLALIGNAAEQKIRDEVGNRKGLILTSFALPGRQILYFVTLRSVCLQKKESLASGDDCEERASPGLAWRSAVNSNSRFRFASAKVPDAFHLFRERERPELPAEKDCAVSATDGDPDRPYVPIHV
jgi:hypothetical protein